MGTYREENLARLHKQHGPVVAGGPPEKEAVPLDHVQHAIVLATAYIEGQGKVNDIPREKITILLSLQNAATSVECVAGLSLDQRQALKATISEKEAAVRKTAFPDPHWR